MMNKEKKRKYQREYNQRPEVKKRRRESQRKYREKNKEKRNEKDFRIRERNRNFVFQYKQNRKCVICGYSEHPEILCFHHIKKSKDNIWIKNLTQSQYSLKRIKEEMNKCILICPNCHYWIHHKNNARKRIGETGRRGKSS